MNLALAEVLADPRRVAAIPSEEIPVLLGEIERLRTALWAQLVRPLETPRVAASVDADEYLTVPEAAAALRFTDAYLYEAVRRQDLPAIRKGRYVRIRRDDLRAWLDGRAARGLDPHSRARDSARHGMRRNGPPATRAVPPSIAPRPPLRRPAPLAHPAGDTAG